MKHTRDVYATASGDRNDCSVRSLATAACLPYDDAHAAFAKHGRKSGRKTPTSVTAKVVKDFFPHAQSVKGGITLNRFVAAYPVGHFVVHVRGHALAVCDGVVHDWKPGQRRQVRWAWRIC